jgi:nicotinamidase/pyrazinamidase
MEVFMQKLLLVVDFQKDFVDGSLGFADAVALDARIAEKIRVYRRDGDVVAFTYDTHAPEYLDTQEGKHLPVVHCVEGTPGWELYGDVGMLRQPEDPVFKKPSFGSAELMDWLRVNPFAGIELVGVVTNICVLSNAVIAKTAQPETPVLVDAACVAGNDPALHEAALDVLQSIHVRVTHRDRRPQSHGA